ncbi:drug/metabolite transporter (DMT)-like permease [Rhodobacter aestuarii]|uniref:Permease of the drug/metabolite transporter (DMT) superfamily n=1 Tax=Rhodobacter aestuarii TaxID=453582 RepID=A0A1N7Q0I8_9RHOB|nr:DMT family transporter [Rhodobacter aestuarii]PTV93997.1 drug/metabolite transporter (DMT)-like permease [Rhodobacter aestuarii]SIT16325.1 Permease of the drug/metabolite transporter (DMT) superfamily [Rhodobacter aestuarii]
MTKPPCPATPTPTLPTSAAHPPIGRVALWMLGAIGGFTTMAMAGRAAAPYHDTFEIMLWRSAIGIFLVMAGAALTGRLGDIRARNLRLHGARNISHFIGQNLWFAALPLIPLAQVFALEFSYPLIVALAAPFVLGEVLTARRLFAAALGFAGVLIVAQPWSAGTVNIGTALVLAAAVGFAGSALATKELTKRAPLVEILFWLTVMQFVFALICALWDGQLRLPNWHSIGPLIFIGFAGLSAHLCLTRALSLAPASVVAPFDFARLPVSALVGVAIYGEPLTAALVVGAALILYANWINIKSKPNR